MDGCWSMGGAAPANDLAMFGIDTSAVTGLRGVLAVHIMLYHCFMMGEEKFNLMGTVQVPLFLIISGFTLAVNEGRTLWGEMPLCGELTPPPAGHYPPQMDARRFYWRRFARTAPVYYLCTLLAIPLYLLGQGWGGAADRGWLCYPLSLLPVSTWTGWLPSGGWDGARATPPSFDTPAWFVSTVWFFYLLFPSVLPQLQRMTGEDKQRWTIRLFWIHLVVVIITHRLSAWLLPAVEDTLPQTFPPIKLPVFLMGVLTGLLRITHSTVFQPLGLLRVLRCAVPTSDRTPAWWAFCVDCEAAMVTVLMIMAILYTWYFSSSDVWVPGSTYIQVLVPFSQVTIVYGLTCDSGQSRVSRALSAVVVQWLGRISYSLYLIHVPVIQALTWLLHGSTTQPSCVRPLWEHGNANSTFDVLESACEKQWSESSNARRLPDWGIPIVVGVSLALAALVCHCFEEPVRRRLNSWGPKNPQQSRLWAAARSYGSFDIGVPKDDEQSSLLSKSHTEGALEADLLARPFPSRMPYSIKEEGENDEDEEEGEEEGRKKPPDAKRRMH